jgi:thiamine-monophosphate kinase
VTGDLGAAYMGLQLLEREKSVYYQQVDEARKKNDKHALEELKGFQPDFAGKEYLLQRQLQTEARGDIIARFRELNIRPTAMIDISDGLSSELMHICKQSNCGCRIYEKNIPIDYQTAVMAEELNMNVTTCALNGGEDYELLFTVPIGDHEKIQQMDNVKLIGHITRPELGQMLYHLSYGTNCVNFASAKIRIIFESAKLFAYFLRKMMHYIVKFVIYIVIVAILC